VALLKLAYEGVVENGGEKRVELGGHLSLNLLRRGKPAECRMAFR
jgi:hypothetical protein